MGTGCATGFVYGNGRQAAMVAFIELAVRFPMPLARPSLISPLLAKRLWQHRWYCRCNCYSAGKLVHGSVKCHYRHWCHSCRNQFFGNGVVVGDVCYWQGQRCYCERCFLLSVVVIVLITRCHDSTTHISYVGPLSAVIIFTIIVIIAIVCRNQAIVFQICAVEAAVCNTYGNARSSIGNGVVMLVSML